MATKTELVEELGSQASKAELVRLLDTRLKKDELASLVEDDSGGTKAEVLRRLGSRTKSDLLELVGRALSKDDVETALDERRPDPEPEQRDEDEPQQRERREVSADRDLDWSAELAWSRPPRPTPAPVQFRGAAPFMPGQRVRVDLAGLPMLGIFLGKGASAAGTIVGVDARRREVRVYLDGTLDGSKEIVLPPERVVPDG